VSEETIRSLAGHVSKQMLQRYSHIRTHAKQAAIAALEQDAAMLDAVDCAKRKLSKLARMGHRMGHIQSRTVCTDGEKPFIFKATPP